MFKSLEPIKLPKTPLLERFRTLGKPKIMTKLLPNLFKDISKSP